MATTAKGTATFTCVHVFPDTDLREIAWNEKKIHAALATRNVTLKDGQLVHFINKTNTKGRSIVRHSADVYTIWCWMVDNQRNWFKQHAQNLQVLVPYAHRKVTKDWLQHAQQEANERAIYRVHRLKRAAKGTKGTA